MLLTKHWQLWAEGRGFEVDVAHQHKTTPLRLSFLRQRPSAAGLAFGQKGIRPRPFQPRSWWSEESMGHFSGLWSRDSTSFSRENEEDQRFSSFSLAKNLHYLGSGEIPVFWRKLEVLQKRGNYGRTVSILGNRRLKADDWDQMDTVRWFFDPFFDKSRKRLKIVDWWQVSQGKFSLWNLPSTYGFGDAENFINFLKISEE